jgi:hypothetical protein
MNLEIMKLTARPRQPDTVHATPADGPFYPILEELLADDPARDALRAGLERHRRQLAPKRGSRDPRIQAEAIRLEATLGRALDLLDTLTSSVARLRARDASPEDR